MAFSPRLAPRLLLPVACLVSSAVFAQQPRRLTLSEAITLAHQNGADAKAAAAQLEVSRAQARRLAARSRPRVDLTTGLLNFNRSIDPITLPDGSQSYVGRSNNIATASLDVSQELPFTGGRFSVGTDLSRTDQFGNLAGQSWRSTPIVFGFQQPLFQVNALQWDRRESEAALELSERQELDIRGQIDRDVAVQYMSLHRAQVALRNAEVNAAVADTVLALNEQRYRISTAIDVLDLSRSELDALNARMTADESLLNRDRLAAQLALMIGLPLNTPIETVDPVLPDTTGLLSEAVIEDAGTHSVAAARFRADSIFAERRLATARASSRATASLSANIGFNQTANTLPNAYQSPLGRQQAVLGLTLPILEWGAARASIDVARYSFLAAVAAARRGVDQAKVDARFAARSLSVSTRQLQLATVADSIANVQFRIARLQYGSGSLSYNDYLQVQRDKDAAVLRRVDAAARFWDQYYNFRRLTAASRPRQ